MPLIHPTVAAEDQLGALLNAAVDPMVLIDERGRITRFNAAAEHAFGYAAEEVLGRNVNMLMPEPYHTEHDGYMERYQRTGDPHIIGRGREVVARRSDGSTFPIILSVGEFRTSEAHGYVGILRDITDAKRQEALLRQSTEELRLIVEFAPMAILITDLHGHIISVNRACCELLGYSADALRAMRHSDLIVAEDRSTALEAFRHLRRDGGSCQCELSYLHASGVIVPALHYAALATDADGDPLMVIGEIIDRTELYAATREAEELRERLAHVARVGTLGEMVSGIAHEVNQPLTAIANYANACRRLMLGGQTQPGEVLAALDKIAAQAERAGHVIRGLRALSKRGETRRDVLDCNQLVRDIVRLVDIELRSDEVQLEVRRGEDLPRVIVDGVQIQQVILNLVRNSIDAMVEVPEARREIVLRTLVDSEGDVEFMVADRGVGVEATAMAELFNPFFTTKPGGTGLGLSISRSIVRAHGGKLWCGANPGGGARFFFTLPAVPASAGS